MAYNLNSVQLPPVIVPQVPQLQDDAKAEAPKKMVILYTKAITSEDVEVISRYGKVLRFNSSLINIPWASLHCQFLLCDATDKVCLANVERQLHNPDLVFCHYGSFYESETFPNINHVSKIRYCATRDDFYASMLEPKELKRPNKVVSFLSFLVNCLAQLKR